MPYEDQCCDAPSGVAFDYPDQLRAALVQTVKSTEARVADLERELRAQRLLRDAAHAGLVSLDSEQCVQAGSYA